MARKKGFTFIEVLFAVILLGIGFIMIATLFPVAIRETKAVSDETQANALAHNAIAKIQSVADVPGCSPMFPPTLRGTVPIVSPLTPQATQDISGDTVSSVDSRYGYAAFYRRDSLGSPSAYIYTIALEGAILPMNLTAVPATLIKPGSDKVAYIQFAGQGYPSGCFVLIADDGSNNSNTILTGRFLRLGLAQPNGSYSLQAGYDFTALELTNLEKSNGNTADEVSVYVVGNGQDIGASAGMVSVNRSNN